MLTLSVHLFELWLVKAFQNYVHKSHSSSFYEYFIHI